MISADILRGRYRESFETAKPIKPRAVLPYHIRLPHAHHTFLPGHRIMVQVQSSWFPLYDRNPQTFVANIAYAQPQAYRKAVQRIYQGSFVELPVTTAACAVAETKCASN
jgi:predicted acyl esterase